MLGFFVSSLTNVTQRYLSIGIGFNNTILTQRYFKQCGTILFVFSIITILLGETIGVWFVMNKLVIPIERLNAAFWVFQFSLISIFCSINQINYEGAVISFEKMNIYAYIGIFEAIARLIIAYAVVHSSFDHLIVYSILTALVSVIVLAFHIIYCRLNFKICVLGLCWDNGLVGEMIKFISANLFGCFAWSAGVQGSNIIMNLFLGPIVNAAKGISMQISSVVSKFTSSIMTAIKPQIIKSYASGDVTYMMDLVMKSSKLTFFISSIIVVPILIEIEFILKLWLNIVPEYAVSFSRIVIVESLAMIFISPLWISANATGNIKRNQVYGRIFTLSILPLSYITLSIKPNAVIVVSIGALMQYLYWFYCIYDIKKQLNLNVFLYIKSVIIPSFSIFIILFIIGVILNNFGVSGTFIHFLMTFVILIVLGVLFAYLFMTHSERKYIYNILRK